MYFLITPTGHVVEHESVADIIDSPDGRSAPLDSAIVEMESGKTLSRRVARDGLVAWHDLEGIARLR